MIGGVFQVVVTSTPLMRDGTFMDGSFWGDLISSSSPIVIVFLFVIMGWLVPGSIMKARMRDKDDEIRRLEGERDSWRAAAQTKDRTIQTLTNQLDEAMESGRTSLAVFQALSKVANGG